ncbi:DUF4834 family protein [Tenacibaculum sp. M341]|uniref:DUF4834 family protein n=1 Tax=Tenacibaculum sp. M341 TaxID=2530339 RepID=UPI001FB2FF0D|nr:DUF4834 family protein [Tenacibaculum sp. M341]
MLEIHQAGPMSLIRTILILLFIYYAFKFLAKLFGPYILKKAVNKMEQKARKQYQQDNKNNVKVGETIIDKKPKSHQQSNNGVGEYIDFEEID